MVMENGDPFVVEDVEVIEQVLLQHNFQVGTRILLGQEAFWLNGLPDAYNALLQRFNIHRRYQLDDGTYGIEIVDGVLNPVWVQN